MLNLFKKPEVLVEIGIYVRRENGVFYAYSPSLPGLFVEGETEAEVLQNAKDASIAYLLSLIKHKEPLPVGPVVKEIPVNEEEHKIREAIPAYA